MYVCILDATGPCSCGQLLPHIQNTRAQYNLPEFGRRPAYPANRVGVREHFPDPSVRKSIAVDLKKQSGGQTLGTSGGTMGHVHLK